MEVDLMKPLHYPIIRTGLVLFGAVMMLSGSALAIKPPLQSFSLKDPPAIDLQKCIQVQNALGHNPFSPMPNDFLAVTKYEEKSDETGAMKGGLKPGRALNMYLAISAQVSPENPAIGIARSSILVVKISTLNAESSTETVRSWIFTDEDGDGTIDNAVFREDVAAEGKETIGSNTVNFPENRLQELQTYFEKAVLALKSRTKEGLGEGCVIN
jgi:hypothetical protein